MMKQQSLYPSLFALLLGVGVAILPMGHSVDADQVIFPTTADASANESTGDAAEKEKAEEGWISLFNGKDLEGWKAAENPEAFTVKDGELIVKGNRGHLFYTGDVEKANFKNFKWKVEVLTKPKANSGLYFHTKYQDEGWPSKGYEVQVNNTHSDPKKTGGLYAIADVIDTSPVKDNEWFTMEIIVKGKRVIVKVNDKVTTDYIEPENPDREGMFKERVLSEGTIAIQAHDPGSVIHFRNIRIKPLPADKTADAKQDEGDQPAETPQAE